MPARKRAQDADTGHFVADDPTTPDVNEAFAQPPAPQPTMPSSTFDPHAFLNLPAKAASADDCLKAIDLARRATGKQFGVQLPKEPVGLPKGPTEAIRVIALKLVMERQLSEVPTVFPRLARYHFMRPFNAR